MSEPLTISDAAKEAEARAILNADNAKRENEAQLGKLGHAAQAQVFDGSWTKPLGHFVQLAMNAAVEKAMVEYHKQNGMGVSSAEMALIQLTGVPFRKNVSPSTKQ